MRGLLVRIGFGFVRFGSVQFSLVWFGDLSSVCVWVRLPGTLARSFRCVVFC